MERHQSGSSGALHHSAAANGGGGGYVGMMIEEPHFNISAARAMLFSQLPKELRTQTAYRHFFTDELNRGIQQESQVNSSVLSLKFFGSLIMYLCALFRLENRRKHYENNPTEKAGKEFASAHKKAKAVFHFLSTMYGTILMTYNVHNELVIPRRITPQLKLQLAKGKDTNFGLKNPLPVVKRELAFTYESDELRFYEELFCMSEEMVKLAFNQDEGVKKSAQDEIQRLFRSSSFRFAQQTRENEILSKTGSMERQSKGLLNNNRRMVELLQPNVPNLVLKYAIQQRSPFVANKFTGGTGFMKYQRVKKASGAEDEPSKLEKVYRVETGRTTFFDEHPALVNIPKSQRPKSRSATAKSVSRKRQEVNNARGTPPAGNATPLNKLGGAGGPSPAPSKPTGGTAVLKAEKIAAAQNLLGKSDMNNSDTMFSQGMDLSSKSGGGTDPNLPHVAKHKTTEKEKKYLGNLADFDDDKNNAPPDSEARPNFYGRAMSESAFNIGPQATTSAEGNQQQQQTTSGGGDVVTELTIRKHDKALTGQGSFSVNKLKGAAVQAKNAQKVFHTIEKTAEEEAKKRQAPVIVETPRKNVTNLTHALAQEEEDLNFDELSDEAWINYNPTPDIEAMYQSMRFGIEAPTFKLPQDLGCEYDEQGHLMPQEEEIRKVVRAKPTYRRGGGGGSMMQRGQSMTPGSPIIARSYQ